MTKTEFLARLRQKLFILPQRELEDTLEYYSEMIDDYVENGKRKRLFAVVRRRAVGANSTCFLRKRHGSQGGNALFQYARTAGLFEVG